MSASIEYEIEESISESKIIEINNRIDELTNDYCWWAESMELGFEGAGSTKLFRLIEDPMMDMYMASLDMEKILEIIKIIAKETQTNWVITMEGAEFGQTENCELSDSVIKQSQIMNEAMGIDSEEMPSREEIFQMYD